MAALILRNYWHGLNETLQAYSVSFEVGLDFVHFDISKRTRLRQSRQSCIFKSQKKYSILLTYNYMHCLHIYENSLIPHLRSSHPLLKLLEIRSTLLRVKGRLVLKGRVEFNVYFQSISHSFDV